MPDSALTNSRIVAAYRERTPGSEALAREARDLFPSGITHDSRYTEPYGLYVERAEGPRKWDVDGNEYVDYFGGHGALLLGHNDPRVTAAVGAALARGTHFGASHAGELRWAKAVQAMVPSAERVRFTSSGTEATHMALRLARAFTGREKIMRLKTHFHGWHDHMASAQDNVASPGVVAGVAEQIVLVPPGDLKAAADAFARGAVAAVILEPTGASFGMAPVSADYVAGLRDLSQKHGALLIFDEVVTGFRVSPGGAQAAYGIVPDLTTLAKILAGGLPGGALVGRREIMDLLDFDAAKAAGREKVGHQGTFNANPVSAAAGATTLEIIAAGDACARANAFGATLRAALAETFAREGVAWGAYGTFSGFHVFLNPKGRDIRPERFDPFAIPYDELKAAPQGLVNKLRLAMNLNGVDLQARPGGIISATHGEAELDQTVMAFREAIRLLRADGEI